MAGLFNMKVWLSTYILLLQLTGISNSVTYTNTSNGLTNVPPDIPVNVDGIDLSDNSLSQITSGTFGHFSNLKILNLAKNVISAVDDAAFSGTKLISLRFTSNKLTTLPQLASVALTLKVLILSKNFLAETDWKGLCDLVMLESLTISYNDLTSLPNITCLKDSLLNLEAFGNLVSNISKNYFAGFAMLKKVNLGKNLLMLLPDFNDVGLATKTAVFKANQLEIPESGILRGISSLRVLDLSDCGLSIIPDLTDAKTKLRKLFLNNNPITDIPSDYFKGFTWLTALYMDGMKILDVPVLNEVGTSLTHLSLNSNNLQIASWQHLQDLTFLQVIYMESCNLTEIPTLAGSHMSLLEMHLHDNNITFIPDSYFVPFVVLSYVGLNDNKLVCCGQSFTVLIALLQQLPSCQVEVECWNHLDGRSYGWAALKTDDTDLICPGTTTYASLPHSSQSSTPFVTSPSTSQQTEAVSTADPGAGMLSIGNFILDVEPHKVLFTTKARFKLRCAALCQKQAWCLHFHYQKLNSTCLLSGEDEFSLPVGTVSTSGWYSRKFFI